MIVDPVTFTQTFYLFILPLGIAAAGVAIAYYGRTDHEKPNKG